MSCLFIVQMENCGLRDCPTSFPWMSLLRSGAFQYLLEVNFYFFYLRSKNSGGTGTLPNVNIAKHMYTVFRQEILKWRVNHMLSSLYVIAPSPSFPTLQKKYLCIKKWCQKIYHRFEFIHADDVNHRLNLCIAEKYCY